MLRRSSLVECVSVLPGNRCLQNVEFCFLRHYVQPCLLKNPKYTFYTIKSSLKLAYSMSFICSVWLIYLIHPAMIYVSYKYDLFHPDKCKTMWIGRSKVEKHEYTLKADLK